MRLFQILLFLSLSLCWTVTVNAQIRPGQQTESQGPISISADSLEAQDQQGVVTFKGSVLARQGGLSISCDAMQVSYKTTGQIKPQNVASADTEQTDSDAPLNPLAPNSAQQIDRVECDGNVRIVEGDRLAVGNKALYLAQALPRRIVLTGDARIWQGADSVTGHEVTYFLDDRRSTVESQNNNRVRATYHQENDKKPEEAASPATR